MRHRFMFIGLVAAAAGLVTSNASAGRCNTWNNRAENGQQQNEPMGGWYGAGGSDGVDGVEVVGGNGYNSHGLAGDGVRGGVAQGQAGETSFRVSAFAPPNANNSTTTSHWISESGARICLDVDEDESSPLIDNVGTGQASDPYAPAS